MSKYKREWEKPNAKHIKYIHFGNSLNSKVNPASIKYILKYIL